MNKLIPTALDPAAAGASSGPEGAAMDTRQQYATFILGQSRYAVAMESLAQILPLPPVVPVPLSPASLAGVANLRGQVIPVIRLRAVFGIAGDADPARARLLVLKGRQPVGFIVDRIATVMAARAADIESSSPQAAGQELLQGVVRQGTEPALLVDLQQLVERRFATLAGDRRAAGATLAPVARRQGERGAAAAQQLISFSVAGQLYALPVEQVQEILRWPESTMPVPNARAHLLGVTVHRDRLLPVVSLRQMLSLPEPGQGTRLLVISVAAGTAANDYKSVGLLVDAVCEIFRAPDAAVESLPPLLRQQASLAEITAIYHRGHARRLVSILSATTLFSQEDAIRVAAAATPLARDGQANQEDAMEESMQIVVFRLGNDEFGVPVAVVDEVVRAPETLTRMPKAPDFVHGMMNLRGKVLPVIDQRQRFGLAAGAHHARQRILVVTVDAAATGLIVDAVNEIRTIPVAAVEEAPVLSGEQAKFISKLVNLEAEQRIILLLDIAQLLSRSELKALARLRESARQP